MTVRPGTTVREAAARAGVFLDYPCGGQGTCGKCRIRLARGSGTHSSAERNLLTERERSEGIRLACQCAVENTL
ncbi:MAG: 2Fe-2S iron-sulfur cluster binding domain-containing protein, partial [Candidatus Hydrogenedentes bacterium]|nr:2Fe-2S iron-sulfur cluster binding domain-containing protein [Candidatus Hydrogenedentota bacterium]